jgi:hypothetical protein
MFKLVSGVALAALVCFGGAKVSSATTLLGNNMQAQYLFPDTSTPYGSSSVSPNPFIVGAGIETTIDVEGVTFLDIDFSDTSLLITLRTVLGSPTWNSVAHNGPAFSVLAGNLFPAITTVTASNAGPVSASLLSGVLYVNWAGMSYQNGDTVQIAFAPSAVPLPAALPLLAAGLGTLAVVARRRKRGAAKAAA